MRKKRELVEGRADEEYKEVEDTFRALFAQGWEPQGAGFAAFVDGKCVVDLWGGYADRVSGWTWKENTMTTVFSCTKSLAAICVAKQVDEGRISYDDKVGVHWPEFAQGGKEDVTIGQVLAHQAAIPYLREENGKVSVLDIDDVNDPDRIDRLVEKQKTLFPPGVKSAYHALTYGLIVDGLFRRVDPLKRSIGAYFKEEIAQKHSGVDVHIGCSTTEEHRIAVIHTTMKHKCVMLKELINKPRLAVVGGRIFVPCSIFARALQNLQGIALDLDVFNNPDMRKTGMPAVNGVSTARGLARVLDLFSSGQIVSEATLEKYREPLIVDQLDPTIGQKISKGHGFMYTKSPLGDWQYGHTGVGGQNVKTDKAKRITFAYITNGMKAGQGEDTHSMKTLELALYKCFQKSTANGTNGTEKKEQ